MPVEVLGSVERQRRWSRDEKMRTVVESLEPGAKVAEVARRNDVAPSVLFAWRRQARRPAAASTTMVPVMIAEPAVVPSIAMKPRRARGPAKERGHIEIDLGGGRRVRVDAGVDAKALARVLDVLGADDRAPERRARLVGNGPYGHAEEVRWPFPCWSRRR